MIYEKWEVCDGVTDHDCVIYPTKYCSHFILYSMLHVRLVSFDNLRIPIEFKYDGRVLIYEWGSVFVTVPEHVTSV